MLIKVRQGLASVTCQEIKLRILTSGGSACFSLLASPPFLLLPFAPAPCTHLFVVWAARRSRHRSRRTRSALFLTAPRVPLHPPHLLLLVSPSLHPSTLHPSTHLLFPLLSPHHPPASLPSPPPSPSPFFHSLHQTSAPPAHPFLPSSFPSPPSLSSAVSPCRPASGRRPQQLTGVVRRSDLPSPAEGDPRLVDGMRSVCMFLS